MSDSRATVDENEEIRTRNGELFSLGEQPLKFAGRAVTNWRAWMRKNTRNGAEIHEILLEIARGNARTVTLLDGKQAVVVPTPEVRARVAIHLDEMLHGKAVTQNEQQRAEREAGALAAVQALSDEVLAVRAQAALQRIGGASAVTLAEGESEAELVPDEVRAVDVWEASLDAAGAEG